MLERYGKTYTRRLAVFAAACILCGTAAGCGQTEEEETMSEVIPVQVTQPEAGSLTLTNEFVGTVSPEESVYVIPMVSAEVLSQNVSVGDVVSAGDELCQLDSEAAQLQLASAQAQYDSAAAGVDAAKLGYDMAQAQYEGTVAQLDAQLWGQRNLQLYQLQAQEEGIQANIDSINGQKADLANQRSNAQKAVEEFKVASDQAAQYCSTVENMVEALKAAQEADNEDLKKKVLDVYGTLLSQHSKELYGETLTFSSSSYSDENYNTAIAVAQQMSDSAQALQSQAATALAQAQSGLNSIDQGAGQLDSALAEANRGLEQAQTVMNITKDQVYADTQKVVDANKEAAALSLDSAEASINSAQLGVEGAQIAVDSAEYQLAMYTLKAPIGGVIEAVNLKEHDFATPSTPAYVISNKDTMMVTFYVSEGIRNTLTVGQKVSVDRNGRLYDAAITEIGSMIDQNTGLFAVKACVSAPDESLLTGCSVKVAADTYSQGNVLLIPYDAVYYDDSQSYVYVAVNGVAERRDIETGIFDEQTITVLSGLTAEDQLITSWSANLREGASVSIQEPENAAEDAADSDE